MRIIFLEFEIIVKNFIFEERRLLLNQHNLTKFCNKCIKVIHKRERDNKINERR